MDFIKREPKIFVIAGKANAGKDTTKQMALLNKLHSQWGLG